MRSIIKMLGLAFVAMLAFSAFGAGSASALLFLTANAKELFQVRSLTLQTLLTLGGHATICHSVLGDGLILNKTDFAHKILLTFHECESEGFSCQSAGEPNGLIKTLELHALLVTLLTGLYGIVVLSEKGEAAEFECGGLVKIVVTGQVAGEFPEKNKLEAGATEAKLVFARKAGELGMPSITSWWTLEGRSGPNPKYEATLSGLINEKAEASQEGTVDITTTNVLKLCHN